MNCSSCHSLVEPNARCCGVCGYRLPPSRGTVGTPPITERCHGEPGHAAPSDPAERMQPAGTSPAQNPKGTARSPRPETEEEYLGQVLSDRFKIESKIGAGRIGAVYRAVQLATGRKVAVKLLHSDMTYDNEVVARLRREVMLVCKLRDAHTATIYDVDQTPWGTPYIAMELLEGESLNHTLCLGPLEWKRVFKILVEACSSLAEAHAQGIVHRNLKPENIYLEWRSGNLEFTKILDYGIANLFGRGQRTRGSLPSTTNVLPLVQVLEYASPEQLMGRALDGRSDIYALGVLAYAMITWRLPFPEARGPQGLISAQLKQTPSAPSLVCPGARLPRAADRAILRCLEKDRHNRYPDVTQLAAELQALIADPRGA